jgi:hypothetical protein
MYFIDIVYEKSDASKHRFLFPHSVKKGCPFETASPLGKAPYAVYYFEPSKNRIKTDQKALSLRDALQTAFEKPLYVRTSTYVLDKKPFTNSYFFDNANEDNNANAIFRTCLYFQNDKYYLLLEVRGKK